MKALGGNIMHSDPLDDLFANITPDSPIAAEMEALLREGLPVEPDELEAATSAVLARKPRSRRIWWGVGAAVLVAAGAMAYVGSTMLPEGSPTADPEVTLIEPSAAPLSQDSDPGSDPSQGGLMGFGREGGASSQWSVADLASESRDLSDRLASMSHCLHKHNVMEGMMYGEVALEIVKSGDQELVLSIQSSIETFNAGLDEVEESCEPRAVPAFQRSATETYKEAFALYEAGDYALARESFEAVIETDPGSAEAVYAANLVVDTYAKAEDWQGLETTAQRFYEDDELGDEAFESQMLNIAARAAMKQVDETARTPQERADAWVDVVERYGDVHGARDRAVEALHAAGRHDEADQLVE